MRWIVAGLGVLALVGCSTDPVTLQTAKQVSADRIYDRALLKRTSADQAKVTFLRDSGFVGAGCSHDIYVDQIKALALRQGEGASVYVSPGEHLFRMETGGGLCPNVATSQEANLKPGGSQTYRILLPSDGSLRFIRIE